MRCAYRKLPTDIIGKVLYIYYLHVCPRIEFVIYRRNRQLATDARRRSPPIIINRQRPFITQQEEVADGARIQSTIVVVGGEDPCTYIKPCQKRRLLHLCTSRRRGCIRLTIGFNKIQSVRGSMRDRSGTSCCAPVYKQI